MQVNKIAGVPFFGNKNTVIFKIATLVISILQT